MMLRSSVACNQCRPRRVRCPIYVRDNLSRGRRTLPQHIRQQHSATGTSHLPRLAQSSLWETVFPKSIREKTKDIFKPTQKRQSNPASYFIWIYILIGSQAIRILGVKNESNSYMRKADLQIAKLREVVGKLQRGEEVDVEKALGTGNDIEEQEWEDALRAIESEERAWQQSKKEEEAARKKLQDNEIRTEADHKDTSPINGSAYEVSQPPSPSTPPNAPGFY